MRNDLKSPPPEFLPAALGAVRRASRPLALLAIGAGLLLAACGGGGDTGGPGTSGATLSGTVVKGPVGGAAVTAFAVANGTKAAQLGTAATDAQGRFTMTLGSHTGPVMIEAIGGTYTDEATGATMTMQAGSVMTAVMPAVDAGAAADVQVTPLTSMAQARAQSMPGGMTAANVGTANSELGGYFSVGDLLHTMPMNPLVQGSGAAATQEMKNYGMTIAAMSQYAAMIGMTTSSSGVVTAMMRDASDGVMNGMSGSTAVSMSGMGGMMGGSLAPSAGTADLADAMSRFVSSGMNRSGVALADMQALMDRLRLSDGQLSGTGTGTTSGMLTGRAFMGTMSGGTIGAFAVQNGQVGAMIASAALDSTGSFSLPLGSYTGPMMLRVSGASYADEATGSRMTMLPRDVLTAGIPAAAAGMSDIQVTPLTSMAELRAQAMTGGSSAENIAAANSAVATYFSCGDLLTTAPMDPSAVGSGSSADANSRNYGMSIAAMSQYAQMIGMTTSSGIVTVMMDDASDGVMNGMMGTTPISMTGMGGMMGGGGMMQPTVGTSGLATAMTTFVGDTSVNRSGVTMADMQPLVDQLARSNGVIQ
ncbi:carboxypeptidase-like regulatory domain-containing protein [Anaeromyxobacter sp. SG64]|uniref:carboxypeptidase-like regulatory domain-containing protein n=1 Tax=Anaeromyxobacter sp. SG64 TaxID=2925409 RepID=UPI001F568C65|nr:carboxypeptidase-like regulatory domain-containing protein [Anaeromyxobacter sp. SG64]